MNDKIEKMSRDELIEKIKHLARMGYYCESERDEAYRRIKHMQNRDVEKENASLRDRIAGYEYQRELMLKRLKILGVDWWAEQIEEEP